ncbi:MAG TPA: hypothetical protein IGS53_19995 [Leptolyngbyaceae cyanobacterium M33_DOE_097]|uniref:Glutamine amidotransferase domain-containing protein n=1 Tax=Oscillatoriales cyanobacterium SpSt-418 TaxID=2282169 RepID=A0A7C3KDR9_9CYAN|nr:hypothetical protein [Leptolyngbyaceae cyanobacterium M33_DOE_097]
MDKSVEDHPFQPTFNWRLCPGYLSEGNSDFESVHVLIGQFLADRHSPDPLPDESLLSENLKFGWGKGRPLEKVIGSNVELEFLMHHPVLFRNAISIIEPWHHVGHNPLGEEVRASLNVAYIAQKIADCDSILFPVWSSGLLDPEVVVPLITSGLAVVVEGGNPSVRDASTFNGANCSLDDLHSLIERLLISRSPTSALALFICLGHQLAAQGHINLIKRAVRQVLSLDTLPRDRDGRMMRSLRRVCQRIELMGCSLKIMKRNGHTIEGWDDPEFAVGPNEYPEVGDRQLHHYQSPNREELGIPQDLIDAHDITADQYEGVIDTAIEYEREVNIAMFHSDEVNQEAILFANWAYRLLHDAMIPHRSVLAASRLSWLLKLPDAVEILCSTTIGDEIVTECSATCIIYRDFESKQVRRSFTCQFHPELLSDLRAVGVSEPPSYAQLKMDDGARLFARLLYEGMQE